MTIGKKTGLMSTILLAVFLAGCAGTTQEAKLQSMIDAHVAKLDPLVKKKNLAFYDAEITGKKECYEQVKKLTEQIQDLYQDKESFAFLQSVKDAGEISDPRLLRQLDMLYRSFRAGQADEVLQKEILNLDSTIHEAYNTYRGSIDGKKVTQSEIYKIMTTADDVELRRKAWRASKEVGNVVIKDLLRLVKLRNKLARSLGYDNYHYYSIDNGEQNVDELDQLFGELDQLTRQPYVRMKAELDGILARGYGIKVEQLTPWHYHDPFFQRTPLVYELNLDEYYAKGDVKELAERFYAGVGMPVTDIYSRSDLYDKPGKNPHAFAEDIDRHGDVRVLCNLNNDERWMETNLHELGHAVYFKYHDPKEPYLLREPPHAFVTEAAAMFFGRLSRNADWMQAMLRLSDSQRDDIARVSGRYLSFQQVLFARWAMVMYNFEKQLYANPDQDLNTLWWDLVEKYQKVQRPAGAPDAGWASKLHFTFAPCYYHNYMLGELLASQWHHYIVKNVLKLDTDTRVSYVNVPEVGQYFKTQVFAPGARYHWSELIERSTGEKLTAKYFAQQFVESK